MQRFKDILCVATPGSIDHVALECAVVQAGYNQARLTVVEVIDEMSRDTTLIDHTQSLEELQAKVVAGHRQGLEKLVAPWGRKIEIQTKVLIGIPFLEIIREILRNGHDLVIKTAESGELLDRVFGSNDMHLLRECPCPVLLVKPKPPKSLRRILAAVDLDDDYPPKELKERHLLNVQVLKMASLLTLSESAELHIVYAWDALGKNILQDAPLDLSEDRIAAVFEEVELRNKQNLNALMDEVVARLEQETSEYLKPQTHLLKGVPRREIPAFSKEINADLVVMGTVARTGISGFFMGNTAEIILGQLNCSVLAIKPLGFKTPVTLEA